MRILLYGVGALGSLMVPYYPGHPDRTKLINYLSAMISVASEYDAVYATTC